MNECVKAVLKCLPPQYAKMLAGVIPEVAAELEFQEGLKVVADGATFTRTTKFMLMTKTEEVFVQVIQFSETVFSIKWRTSDGKKEGDIKFGDIKEIMKHADDGVKWKIIGSSGDTLLDVAGKDEMNRDAWVEGLNKVLQRVRNSPEAMEQDAQPKSMVEQVKEKAAKQEYWIKRNMELQAKERAQAEKKKKFAGAGMKYTALAMMRQDTDDSPV